MKVDDHEKLAAVGISETEGDTSTMTQKLLTLHFVFVHGFGGGGWAFYKIRCLLEKSGHKVSCPDLKSGGIDPTEPKTILTFQDYNQPLTDLLSSLPHNEKVILVGHSAGGLSLTHAIHNFPEKIHVAVFVAATMLRSGFWTHQDFIDGVPDLYISGADSGRDDPCNPTSNSDALPFLLLQRNMHLTPPEDVILYSMLEKEGPLEALRGARFRSKEEEEDEGIDKVPRVYIKSEQDRVLKPMQQDAMLKSWPPSKVYAVDSDHYPFLSKPLDVFGVLLRIADYICNHSAL